MSGDVIDFRRRRGHRTSDASRRAEPASIKGRVPPHNLDAEAAVLSAILLSEDAFYRVIDILKPEHFYSHPNGIIYEAMLALLEAKSKIDIVSVAAWLRERERLANAGGPSYLGQLSDATPAVHHIEDHAQIVYVRWLIRRIIETCQRIAAEGYGDIGPWEDWLDACEQQIYDIVHRPQKSTATKLAPVLRKIFQEQAAAADRGERITGMSTGYERLDAKTSGLYPGDLTIIAARPGIGKTSFVMNLAVNVASPSVVTERHPSEPRMVERNIRGKGVAVFSLEMPREQLATRMVCSEGRVDLGRMRQGFLQPNDWTRLTDASAFLGALPMWIDDTPALSLLEVRAKIRRIQMEYGRETRATTGTEEQIGLVVIDYLQLMKGREGVNSREQEISEISRGLKELAKELKVPIIALSQLNRSVETRSTKDKRPQLSDLRESGAIEQDADTVIFIYRDDYYNESSEYKGIAELIIAKQRNGPTGKVYVSFNGSCTRFDNLAPSDYPREEE